MSELDDVFARFHRVSPRHQQVLACRLLDGRTREECAARYGISPAAWDILFFRAAREYIEGRTDPLDEPTERRLAADLGAYQSRLAPLTAHADALKRRITEAEVARENSPAYRRETWIRYLLAALIIAMTVYFYLHQPPAK